MYYPKNLRPRNRVILISGASSGIGLATTKILLDEGYTLSLGVRDREKTLKQLSDYDQKSYIVNNFEASVAEIIYHGDHTRVRVNVLNNDQFILKIPNASDDIKLNLNDKIKLGWSSHDCRALDY